MKLRVTASLRALMAEVVERLDSAEADAFLDADDAVQVADAYGGRVARDRFAFVFLPDDTDRWEFTLSERQVRDVADGHLAVVAAERERRSAPERGPETGDLLLVWGDAGAEAVAARDPGQVREALAALAARATLAPRWFRLWTRRDDLMFGVLVASECAVQIVWSGGRYATSRGNQDQLESVEAPDGEGGTIQVPWSHFVDVSVALDAAVEFARTGTPAGLALQDEISGDVMLRALGGRADELAGRVAPPLVLP